MVTPVAILDWFRSRSHSAARFRLGSVFLLLALGWPMILPGILSLTPGYVEFQFNSLAALVWVWFPSAVMLLIGLLMHLVPGLRERRVPSRWIGILLALIVPGGLRVAYEHGLDLTVQAVLFGSRAVPALVHVLAAETATSHVTSRSRVARDDVLFLGHSYWAIRLNAANALGRIGPPAATAVPALREALKDPDARVRSSAAAALGRIQGK
jgi:hypothetical protein